MQPVIVIEAELPAGKGGSTSSKWYVIPDTMTLCEFASKLNREDPDIARRVRKLRQVATGEYMP